MLSSKENYLKATHLVSEINDNIAEQLCGGAITTPETTGENNLGTLPTTGNKTSIPSTIAYDAFGLTPFFPDLPTTKLPRLGPLDPSSRTAPTPKNAITITIPLPLPVWS
ncbi:hypothetical protein H6G06_25165 [Anabaena sphaerica FACHB-251]|uniref:Uncharacterized protein n=1 Tax=Anabaena sphaerica FACHB-251 TaxID=2692883 RepID=A0A926WLF1_9NOST|nr:hypothetical protein [Anabaena sphaerica]MBD2296682.1 hypothetical protein [Anabaena sphaerica FACHB-251]